MNYVTLIEFAYQVIFILYNINSKKEKKKNTSQLHPGLDTFSNLANEGPKL